MSVFFLPQFGPFERPLRLHELHAPSAKPGGPKPTPAPKPKPRPKTPPLPPGSPIPPLYVTINVHSTWPFNHNTPRAVLALTAPAIAYGCTVVQITEESNATFKEYGYLAVIAVPAGRPPATLFTLTTSGCSFTDTGSPVAYTCGSFHYEQSIAVTACPDPAPGFTCYNSTDTWATPVNPCDGTPTTGSATTLSSGGPNGIAEFIAQYGSNPFVTDKHYYIYYDGGGCMVNTGLVCPGPAPAPGKLIVEPFGIEYQVNLQEGHAVHGVIWPFATGDAVRTAATFGERTATDYGVFSTENVSVSSNVGYIGNGVTTFTVTNIRWSTVTTALVPVLYPRFTSTTLKRYDNFGPFGKPQSPPPAYPPGAVNHPWNTLTYGEFPLRVGLPPPTMSFDPLTDPA